MPRKLVDRWMAGAAALLLIVVPACSGDDTNAGAPSTTAEAASSAVPVGRMVLSTDGLGVASFGDDAEEALEAARAALGAQGLDVGWGPSFSEWGTCPGTEVRSVIFDRFVLLFGDDSEYATGERHLFSWRLDSVLPETAAPLPRTEFGITIGSSIADIRAAYGAENVTVQDDEFLGTSFTVAGTTFWGRLTANDDTGVVAYMEAGSPCGE